MMVLQRDEKTMRLMWQQISFQNEKTTQSMLNHYHNIHSHWIIVTIQRGINLKSKKIHADS